MAGLQFGSGSSITTMWGAGVTGAPAPGGDLKVSAERAAPTVLAQPVTGIATTAGIPSAAALSVQHFCLRCRNAQL